MICISLMTFSGCTKGGGEYSQRPEFFGFWNAPLEYDNWVDLNIDSSSFATYKIIWERNEHTYTGNAKENDKYLKIHGSKYYFEIIEYPHTIDTTIEKHYVHSANYLSSKLANWKMILYGMQPDCFHVCGTWTYYKADY
jgi:hypothetical protein